MLSKSYVRLGLFGWIMGCKAKYIILLIIPLLISCSGGKGLVKQDSCQGTSLRAGLDPISKGVSHLAKNIGDLSLASELCTPKKKTCSPEGDDQTTRRDVADLLSGKKNALVPKLAFPIQCGTLSSPFGYRRGIFHSGVDIAASKGEPILACADGVVAFAGTRKGYRSYGQTVLVDHGNDVLTHYAHMSKILVRKGQKIAKGDTVGLVGSTGRSTSPHLHLEVKVGSQLYNPMSYFLPEQLKEIQVAKSFSDTPMGPVRQKSRRR